MKGSKQQAIAITLCEELQASNWVYESRGAPARGIGPAPSKAGKSADQHCFEVNFAKITLSYIFCHEETRNTNLEGN